MKQYFKSMKIESQSKVVQHMLMAIFMQETEPTAKCAQIPNFFFCKNRVSKDMLFAGLKIQSNTQCAVVYQIHCLQRRKPFCLKYSFYDFRYL